MSIYVYNISIGHESPYYNDSTWIKDMPNTAGGYGVHAEFTNTGVKTINYVKMTFVPYNAVGDMVACTARGHVEAIVSATGPYAPGQSDTFSHWDLLWYNETIKSVKLKSVNVKYSDGTEETFTGEQAQRRPVGETDAAKLIRLEQRLETINNSLHSLDLTGTGRKKGGKGMAIAGGVFLAIGVLGFATGAASESGFWLFLYLFVGGFGALMLFSGVKDMNSNPEENAAKAKNYQSQLIVEKQKVEAELNKLKNVKTSADPTLSNWGTDDDYWE